MKKSIVSDMNKCYYPDSFVVPFIDIVHDRAVEEIFGAVFASAAFARPDLSIAPFGRRV